MRTEKLHATFSASGSERWLSCSGSIALCKGIKDKPSAYAQEGTTAHEVVEFIMKNDCSPSAVATARTRHPTSMVHHAVDFYNHIVDIMPDGASLLCETKVELDFIEEGMFGTVDAAIVDLFGTLWVIDYKYGKGRAVDPKENTQMIFYALGIAHKYDYNFENVKLAIAQPRIIHKDGFFRTWEVSIDNLIKWIDIFKTGVEKAKDPFAELTPGRWCWFCPAKDICPATNEERFERVQSVYTEI